MIPSLQLGQFGLAFPPAAAGGGGDPSFSSVVLLPHFDGTDGSTTFTDSSSYNRTATRIGTATISTAQSKFGGASLLLNGSSGIRFADSDDFTFGSGDLTIELFYRATTLDGADRCLVNHLASAANANISFFADVNSGSVRCSFYGAGGASAAAMTTNADGISVNTWHHLAATRAGNVFRLFINGTQRATQTVSMTLNNPAAGLRIGTSEGFLGSGFIGNIDELRITKGVARYTANFTPPAAPFPNS